MTDRNDIDNSATDEQDEHQSKQALVRDNILKMLCLQDNINSQINPDWRNDSYPWYRAAWIECAELMEHHGWKWWKKQTPDLDQINLELVDIWHFGLSDCLQHSQDKNLTADALYRSVYLVSLVPTELSLLDATEAFARDCLQLGRFPTLSFAQLLSSAGMDFQTLVKLYMGKNILNSFRQDHGYKTGEYIKIWNGKEDNEHLSEILRELDENAAQEVDIQTHIYQALKANYPVAEAV